MKYTKHMTLKEWNRFNKPVKPNIRFEKFINHSTGQEEPYTSLTMQEVMLSKYNIILDDFETKWKRRYHAITKVVNMKNFDKGMKTFDKSMQAFSKGVGETNKIEKQHKKNLKIINGKSKARSVGNIIWGVTKDTVSQFTEDQRKPKRKRKSRSQCTWGSENKSVDEQIWGKKNNKTKIWKSKQPKFF